MPLPSFALLRWLAAMTSFENSVRQRCSSDTFYILRKIVRKTIIGKVQNCAQVGTVQQNRDKMSLPTGCWLGSLAFINIDWKKHDFNLLSGKKFHACFIGSSLSLSTQHSFSHIVKIRLFYKVLNIHSLDIQVRRCWLDPRHSARKVGLSRWIEID